MTTPSQRSVQRSVIAVAGTYRVYSGGVEVYPELPAGTYRVDFNPMEGHSLSRLADTTPPTEKMYGNHEARIERMLRAYAKSDRSLGVMLSGPGGMGKTMMVRAFIVQAASTYGLPIVRVDSHSPGLASYLDTLGECIVVFDEFEKNFDHDHAEDGDRQAPLLTLFDGTSQTKRLYIVTVNDVRQLNAYMVNRTGRFHYHLRFDYPQAPEIIEYLTDHGVSAGQAEQVASFATGTRLNYDHLRSIAFELTQVGGDFDEVVGDLNIKHIEPPILQYTVTFENAQVNGSIRLDPFVDRTAKITDVLPDNDQTHFAVTFTTGSMKVVDGCFVLNDNITVQYLYCDDEDRQAAQKFTGEVKSLTLRLSEVERIDY